MNSMSMSDAISRLEYVSPDTSNTDKMMCQDWMTFSKCWCKYKLTHDNSTNKHNYSMNSVFANRSKEEEIYPQPKPKGLTGTSKQLC